MVVMGMTENNKPMPESLPDDAMSDGVLVRAGADGELSASQEARLRALVSSRPEVGASLAFERSLRGAVGRAMGDVRAPAGLRERVMRAVEADGASAEGIERASEQTRQPGFWQRRTWLSAMAAVLVVALGIGLIAQAWSIGRGGLDAGQSAYRQELVGFVAREHARTAGNEEARRSKFVLPEPVVAAQELTTVMHSSVAIPACDKGKLKFLGASLCKVPGEGPSAHIMVEPEIGPTMSLFVRHHGGELPMREGSTYVVDTKACGQGGTRVFAWVEGDLAYFLVFDLVEGCERYLEFFGVAEPSAGL